MNSNPGNKNLTNLLPFNFHLRLYAWLVLGFILFTIVGTLSHELGHCAVAKYFGYQPILSYASMTWKVDREETDYVTRVRDLRKQEILTGEDYPEKRSFNSIRKTQSRAFFWITLGGPAQTVLTGTIALVALVYYKRKSPTRQRLSLKSWLLVFFSLFWLREAANFAMGIFGYARTGEWSKRGDEPKLDQYLDLPIGTIEIILAAISFLILAYVVLRVIPATQRITFLAAGLVGGISGFYFWMNHLGPAVFGGL